MSTSTIPTPSIFDFGEHHVRAWLDETGEPRIVAADVCRALEIGNTTMALSRVDPDGVSSTEVIDSMGRTQTAAVVDEGALYELVFASRKPEAVTFRRWVARKVLPDLRRAGPAALPDPEPVPAALVIPRTYAEALRAAADHAERADAAEAQVVALTPRALAADAFLDVHGDLAVGDAAKALSRAPGITTGRGRLFTFMAERGWTYRAADGDLHPYQRTVDAGWLAVLPRSHYHPRTGERVLDAPQIRVTPRGLERLWTLMGGPALLAAPLDGAAPRLALVAGA